MAQTRISKNFYKMNDLKQISLFGFIIIALFCTSCKDTAHERIVVVQERQSDSINNTIEGKLNQIPYGKFEIITYEGCEYLIYKKEIDNNSAYGFMAHKGNCANQIHSYNHIPK